MGKPGIKEIEETKYALKATGVLKIDDDKLFLDVSEGSDGTDMKDLIEILQKVNNELVTFNVVKKETEELE